MSTEYWLEDGRTMTPEEMIAEIHRLTAARSPVWTIEIGGDDSWDTARRALAALQGWHVTIQDRDYEIIDTTDRGLIVRLLHDGVARGLDQIIAASALVTVRTL